MATGRVAEFFKKRTVEVIGAGLLALGLFLLASFISFDPFDPSMDLAVEDAKNDAVTNWGGTAGAWFAVPTLKLLGFTSFVLSLIIIAWGYKVITKSFYPNKIWLRITAFLLSAPILCAFFSCLDRFVIMPEIWPTASAGGYIGQYLNSKLAPVLTYWGFASASALLSILTLYFAAGLTKTEWAHMGSLLTKASRAVMRFVALIFMQGRKLIAQWKSGGELEQPSKSYTPKKTGKRRKSPTLQPEKAKATAKRSIRKQAAPKESQAIMELSEFRDDYQLPPISLLQSKKSGKHTLSESALQQNAEMLEKVLEDFGVQGKIIEVRPGPVVTQYALEPAAGTKSSRVIGLADDIARSMSAVSARIAVIPGQNAIGIELPNSKRLTVYLREMIEDRTFKQTKHKLPLALGKDIGGEPITIDLTRTPHMLVAGTTGSGKSVAVNAMILSLLYKYSPSECKFIMVDPKMLELSMYQDIPHLLTPVVTEPGKAVVALKWTVKEMENRYRLMSNLGVRNMEGYNKKLMEARKKGEVLKRSVQTGFDPQTGKPTFEKVDMDMTPMPFIVVIVDEMADLMLVAGKEIEQSIQRLAQMARAAGIHIILATQRPSVDVITGIIKANFPTRVSFQVTSKIDSRTILGEQGAEQLLGMGDMLYMAGGSRITRVHGPFVDDKEVERVVEHVKAQGQPEYIEEVTTDSSESEDLFGMSSDEGQDEMYKKAVAIVQDTGKASTSFIQRQLRIGYNRAANIVDQLEQDGIISQADHVGRREVLVK